MATIHIIGGGFAGCEAALWLANRGHKVKLYEQRPQKLSPAHSSAFLAELVCSNSFKAMRVDSAGGLLKEEMRRLGSSLLPLADVHKVPAGGALAVNRDDFSRAVTELVDKQENIEKINEEVTSLDFGDDIVLVASGPLTEGALAEQISQVTGGKQLSFYDAAAPIVTAESLDMNLVFAASRYDKGDDDYLNCPFDKAGYEAFYEELVNAESAPLHEFDGKLTVYEGCMPVEVMAKRGPDTLRYGPLRPVGLRDPRTGHRPWANIQLRKENVEGTLYNMVGFQTNLKFGEQKRVFQMVPGLENAEFARYGVMHRNTFLNSPEVLTSSLHLQSNKKVFFAGQITGFEGYMESAACGLLAAHAILCEVEGKSFTPPPLVSMCGALVQYITSPNVNFQPMGANMGLLPSLSETIRDKRERYAALADRALVALDEWIEEEDQ